MSESGSDSDTSQVSKRPKLAEGAERREGSTDSAAADGASSLRCSRRPSIPSIPWSLSDLEKEVEELRQDPPPYVSRVGHLEKPEVVCNGDGELESTKDAEGPWDLSLYISGKEGDEAYGFPFRVVLRFDHELWPSKLAIARFRCVFHHALTDDSGGMLMPFYKALPRDSRGACTVRLMAEAVRNFLLDPLASWKIPTEKAPERFTQAIKAHRNLNKERMEVIQKYSKLVIHQDLFESPAQWKDEWLEPSFCKARKENTAEGWRAILKEDLPGEVFSFRLFTEEFCDKLVEEIFNFYKSGLPARRPNSMNNYGIILNEIGLEPLIDELQGMLQPIGKLVFPGAGSAWDGQHCFIVRYRAGEDLGLDMHTDDSDVTFNICLGLDFTGAGLQFCGLMGAPNHRKHTFTYHHVKGHCVCHLGRKRHGADDIQSGERLNLILWNHGTAYRETDGYSSPPYEKEEGPPDAVCVSYTHDRDYGNFKEYPVAKKDFKGRGWCPRPKFEYDGFKPDCEVERLGV